MDKVNDISQGLPEQDPFERVGQLLDKLAALRQRFFYLKARLKDTDLVAMGLRPNSESVARNIFFSIAMDLVVKEQDECENELFELITEHFWQNASEHSVRRLQEILDREQKQKEEKENEQLSNRNSKNWDGANTGSIKSEFIPDDPPF